MTEHSPRLPAEQETGLVTSVLADVLVMASERDRLVEADRLLRDLVGAEAVHVAHRIWTARLRTGLLRDDGPDHPRPEPTGGDVFHLLQRLRPAIPGGRR